jgi:lipopolysaccharide/colanic/teichoic acid biosynthesis glycosyltransferase
MSSIAQPKTSSRPLSSGSPIAAPSHPAFLEQELFVTMLRLERKRTERSNRRFVLMLLDTCGLLKADESRETFRKVMAALSHSIRETDIKGWYKDDSVIGVIFTEVGAADGKSVANALLTRVTGALCTIWSIEQINQVKLSFHVFPEHSDEDGAGGPTDSALYPDLQQTNDPKRAARVMKRSIDIAGSLFALVLASPFLILISALIKLTSKGPILFRQERVGQYGRKFTFLKFRSMYFRNDHTIHKEYVKRLIAGNVSQVQENGRTPEVYKLTNDPRITPFGRFLRKTSLDEVPQFLNVLAGSMSLVGPRPPVPYEFEAYEMWHRQRLVAVKPGITGQWQVGGRSRTTFDEMVRMDLKYSSSWTVWGDIKILSQTPRAVLSGVGAY